jgi:hypothetical protein
MVTEGDINPVFNYKLGIRFMWPLPDDLLHTLNNPSNLKSFLFDLFNPFVGKNIIASDLNPTAKLIWDGISRVIYKSSQICSL